jgi:hypothetical protein
MSNTHHVGDYRRTPLTDQDRTAARRWGEPAAPHPPGLRWARQVTCHTCAGFGNVDDDYAYVTCQTCGGTGELDIYEDDPEERQHRQC